MRLERLSVNQFKIFLTYNDLKERGYSKEELWNNLPKANELFQDMLYEACDELGIELDGKLVVQVYMLQAQGMVIVVTQNNEGMSNEDFIELKVTMDESKELMFVFDDFEDVIQAAGSFKKLTERQTSLYYYEGYYFVKIHDEELNDQSKEEIISMVSEFSSPSTMTSYVLNEYGKCIVEQNAFEIIQKYF